MTKMVKVKISTLIDQRNKRAIIGRMLLELAAAMRHGHDRSHIGAIFEEFLVWACIIVNDADGGVPVRVADICSRLQLPRTNVFRAVGQLTRIGIVRKDGHRFTQELRFFADRLDGPCFVGARAAILAAAAGLRESKTPARGRGLK